MGIATLCTGHRLNADPLRNIATTFKPSEILWPWVDLKSILWSPMMPTVRMMCSVSTAGTAIQWNTLVSVQKDMPILTVQWLVSWGETFFFTRPCNFCTHIDTIVLSLYHTSHRTKACENGGYGPDQNGICHCAPGWDGPNCMSTYTSFLELSKIILTIYYNINLFRNCYTLAYSVYKRSRVPGCPQ